MGTNESKLAEKLPGDEQNNEKGSVPSTPILTPKSGSVAGKSKLDPRSPSKNISRTPIQLLSTVSDKLEELELNDGPLTPIRTRILGIDPRSPALEFQRTPIVVTATPDKKLPDSIRNKNLDKIRGIAFPTPTSSPAKNPPRLLESTTVTPKKRLLDAAKRKSFVLLETNIDFTETDLDAVIKEKYSIKNRDTVQTDENALFCELDDPRSPAIDFTRTPIQISKDETEASSTKNDTFLTTKQNKADSTENLNVDSTEEPNNENVDITNDLESNDNVCLTTNDVPIQNEEITKNIVTENAQKINDEKLEPEEMLHKSVFGIKFEESVSFVSLSPMSKKIIESNVMEPNNGENVNEIQQTVGVEKETSEASSGTQMLGELSANLSTITVIEEKHVQADKPGTNLVLYTTDQVLEICDEVIRNSPEPTKSKLLLSPIPKANSDVFVQSALMSLNSKVVTPRRCQSNPVTPPLIDLTADVKELDKKLTNLIYEDEDLVVCPRIVKIKEQSRTPLGSRNSTENIPPQRPLQKLKVSDKPRKTDYAVSKIPVFKEKKVKKGQVQCENTPPRGMTRRSEAKPNKSRWDAKDNTLVI